MSWIAFGSAVSVGTPSSATGTPPASIEPPFSEMDDTPVRPANSRPTSESLRIGADLSTFVITTTRLGSSSLIEVTSPILMPLQFTLPPVRRPEAAPSKTMRSGVRWAAAPRFWNQKTKPNAAATTANVNAPIRTKFAFVSINLTPKLTQLRHGRACHENRPAAKGAARPAYRPWCRLKEPCDHPRLRCDCRLF